MPQHGFREMHPAKLTFRGDVELYVVAFGEMGSPLLFKTQAERLSARAATHSEMTGLLQVRQNPGE